MKFLHRLLAVASAAFFIAGSALAQNAGTVTNHAFVLGKGAGTTGYTSLLCGSAQLAVGQSAADPICRTLTGDVTISAAGVTAVGATKVTSAMLNADVFSTAHTWAGQQTFVAPILGTPASGTLTNATGLPIATGVSGLASGIATWLATPSSANLRAALTDETGTGAAYFAGGALGTPSSGTLTNATGLPVSTGISGLATGIASWLATSSSANLATAVTDETGSGALVFATSPSLTTPNLGTPSAAILTNATGLPLSGHTAQGAYTIVTNNSGSSAAPTAVDVTAITAKASPVSADIVLIQDSAASNAFKRTTVGALASAGSVSSIAGNTGAFTLANGIDNSTNQIQLTAARRTLPTIQKFTSGSGTYTTPANVLWIRVRMVGGGGGGGGGGTAVANGTSGGNTTFGTTLLVANGGGNNATGAAGGSASLGAGPIGLAISGTPSGGYTALTANFLTGGFGGASPFGGAGTGTANAAGSNAVANSGSGGGGGGSNNNAGLHFGAAGGGGGGYVEAIIYSPSATYAYAVGAAGSGGAAGTDGFAGGSGAAGIIVVEEYYGS